MLRALAGQQWHRPASRMAGPRSSTRLDWFQKRPESASCDILLRLKACMLQSAVRLASSTCDIGIRLDLLLCVMLHRVQCFS